jgi:hypothetical protein
MKRSNYYVLVVTLLAVLPLVAWAQQTVPSQTRVLVAPASSDIPVLRVKATKNRKPSREAGQSPLVIAESRYRSQKPPAMGADQYQALTGSSGLSGASAGVAIQATPDPVLNYLKLTPRENFHGLGHLFVYKANAVNTNKDFIDFVKISEPELAFVYAKLSVEKGERYLVDFSVSTNHNVTFTMEVNGASQTFGVNKGSHHLLAYLEPEADGEVGVAIYNDQAIYRFYSVEVTKVQ